MINTNFREVGGGGRQGSRGVGSWVLSYNYALYHLSYNLLNGSTIILKSLAKQKPVTPLFQPLANWVF